MNRKFTVTASSHKSTSKQYDLVKSFCSDIIKAMKSGDIYNIEENKRYTDSDKCATDLIDQLELAFGDVHCPADDLKYTMSRKFYSVDDIDLYIKVEFILYDRDVPKSKFKKLSNTIEKEFASRFGFDNVKCLKFPDSVYAEDGYDVELKLKKNIDLTSAI